MSKKTKLLLILNIFAIFVGAFCLIQQLFFEKNPDMGLIVKAGFIFVAYSFGVGRFFFSRIRRNQILLYNQYLPFFSGAFEQNKKCYRMLFSVGNLLNRGKYDTAYGRVEFLKKECVSVYDRIAVLFAEALCLYGKMKYNVARSVLEKVLLEYPGHVTALAFCSLSEQREGMHSQASKTLERLANHDSNYAVSFFKAVYHLNLGEYEKALNAAKFALSVESSSLLSMYVAYKSSLGLRENETTEYYATLIKRYGSSLKEQEGQLRIFLL